jgi:hypothetical protein
MAHTLLIYSFYMIRKYKLAAGDSKNGEQLPLPYSDLLILIYLVDKNLLI